MSWSGLALPRSHMGATSVRAAPPMRSMIGSPAACPARSSSAISTAEWAPLLPSRAALKLRPKAGRIQASRPISSGPKCAEGVARHGRRRRRLAPTDAAVLRLDPDQQIVGAVDRHAGHLHRLRERQRDRNGIDAADHQRRARDLTILRPGASFHAQSVVSTRGIAAAGGANCCSMILSENRYPRLGIML